MSQCIFPIMYFPPISFFKKIEPEEHVMLEKHEFFVKQTYRNRCVIYGANGSLNLTVPIIHEHRKIPMKDVRINYDQGWQKIHWKSLQSAYRSSPYFEFYESQFEPFYHTKKKYLIEFNEELLALILTLLGYEKSIHSTNDYTTELEKAKDYRNHFDPKKEDNFFNFDPYHQVFETKHGFIEDLSIADLIFNEGPNATQYIQNAVHKK